ncbi:MAG: L-rhamnose isomerase, partial [Oscillospiraceae bacterium]
MSNIERNYQIAKEKYAEVGVDSDEALKKLAEVPVSVHCWQIDDLSGFENPDRGLTGGIAATGNDPSKAKNKEEFMVNLNKALSLIPGSNKLALHAIYLDNGGKKIDRDEIEPKHFAGWVDYAKEKKIGLDFNPTYFSHDKADTNFTLSSYDKSTRDFWIEHGKRCRKIGEYFGKELGCECITNHWIPDGYKDYTIDKMKHRELLADSLDQLFAEKIDWKYNIDSVESKVFGLGIESYTVGSHEFYTNYTAIRDNSI